MRIGKVRNVLGLACFICILFWGADRASALTVSPGAFVAQNVEPGEDKDTGIDLVITNDTDKEREFSVKVIPPRPVRDEALKGYGALPDLAWFRLEKTNIIVPANGQGKARIFINIPGDEKYYNQQWAVSCLVEYVGQKGLFQEAVATRYMIETKPKAEISEKPYGDTGIAPGVIRVTKAAIKAKEKPGFKIYNNTARRHTYIIKSFVPREEKSKLSINVTPGLVWAKKASWFRPLSGKVKLEPGAAGEVQLNIKVPEKILTKGGIEALIFIDSDTGERRFMRAQVVE